MKKPTCIALAVLAAGAALASPAGAQVRSEIELTRQQIQTERQALVTAYREYRGEMAPIGDRQVALIMGYAENYGSVTDEYATQMLKEFLAIQKAHLDVLNKYVPRFNKVLPAVKVARFYQLENKLDAVVAFDLAASIPILQ
jgi:hypothetical protein